MKSDAQLHTAMRLHRVFITGGSGFVGRNLIRHYRQAGAEVLALARSEQAARTVADAGAIPVTGSLLDSNLADKMVGCDTVVHAAADTSHAGYSAQQWQVNVEGTRNLFHASRAAGIQRVVHISTESVLLTGQPLVMADETTPLPRKSVGAYSHSKMTAENIALENADKDLHVTVVRPRFVWGKGDTTALPQLMAAVSSGKFAWIDHGNYLTSTTHIDNLCDGVSRALEWGGNGQIYFITDGEPHYFRQFVSQLLATQGLTTPDKSVPRGLIRGFARLGDGLYSLSGGRINIPLNMQTFATSAVEVSLKIDKARTELGYSPKISFAQGLKMMSE